MPLSIVCMSIVFNLANAYLNARWIYTFGPELPTAWLADPRFLIGVALFAFGYWVNHQSDRILFDLRKPGSAGYSHSVRRLLPIRLVPELLRRARRVDRLGAVARSRLRAWPLRSPRPQIWCRALGRTIVGTARSSPTIRKSGRRSCR